MRRLRLCYHAMRYLIHPIRDPPFLIAFPSRWKQPPTPPPPHPPDGATPLSLLRQRGCTQRCAPLHACIWAALHAWRTWATHCIRGSAGEFVQDALTPAQATTAIGTTGVLGAATFIREGQALRRSWGAGLPSLSLKTIILRSPSRQRTRRLPTEGIATPGDDQRKL